MAQYLGISVMTARRHLKAGTLPGLKVGRLWRIKQSVLATYVNERMKEGKKNERFTQTGNK